MKKFSWVVVGTGHAAAKFVTDLKQLPNHSVSHVSSGTKFRANEFLRNHKLAAKTILHGEISTISGADAIYIASHSNQHFDHVLSAISLGVPILCEKPLALSLREVEHLYICANKHNVSLVEGLWTLFLPGFLELKKRKEEIQTQSNWLFNASFGKEFSFDPNFRLYSNEKSGGSLFDLGIYPTAAAVFLLGNLTLESAEIQRASSGLILDFRAILSNTQQCRAELRGSIQENLPNTLRLERVSMSFEIQAPFIGNSDVFFQNGPLWEQIYSAENLSGVGLWKEAFFIEKAASNLVSLEVGSLQEISLSTHRILDAINKIDKGNQSDFLE